MDDASAMIAALPLSMVSLDPETLVPISCNDMFTRCMGPLFKFANADFLSAASDDKSSDAKDRLRTAIESVVNANDESQGRVRVRNIEMTTLAGPSGFPVRKHFDWFISKTETASSSTILLLGDQCTEEDVTQREKDSELIDFFQNAPIALHWLSGNGNVMWANKTEMNVLGYTEEEYIGQPIMKFCPDEEELVLEIFKQLGSGNAIRDVPVRFRTKDGKMVHLLIDSNVRYEKDGSFGHTRCFIRDDTGRKIREARASLLLEETKRSLKMLDNFMSRSLHHLRTPLHVTQNLVDGIYSQLSLSLNNDGLTKAQKIECLNMCKITMAQISQSVMLMTDIADLASFDQGKVMHIHPKITDLEKFGREILEEIPPANHGVDVVLDLCPSATSFPHLVQGPAMAVTDTSVLRRVLQHLLANATDKTISGSVSLQIGYQGNRLTFCIRDTGPGMEMPDNAAEGDLPMVFQKYHQEVLPEDLVLDLDEATSLREKIEKDISSTRKNGLGIGLSLCYHLTQALGGELRCNSKKGNGTLFYFTLPRTVTQNTTIPNEPKLPSIRIVRDSLPSDTNDQEMTTPILENKGKKRMRPISPASFDEPMDVLPEVPLSKVAEAGVKAQIPPQILVVEDTKACAKMLCMTLSKFNCCTKLAENGQIAVNIMQDAMPGTYDLILMDLRMPVMDGLEATRIIKHELGIDTPIVALTGDDNEETRRECENIGFDAFHGKPMKRPILKEVIKQFTGYQVN